MKNFDLATLQPIPTRRQRDARDRERLAEAAHRKHCAKHKGRNHWRNWERRMMERAQAAEATIKNAMKDAAKFRHVAQVRAYWSGAREDHP